MAVDVEELRALTIFETLSPAELDGIASNGERVEIAGAGVEITHQGDFGHSVYAVLEGDAQVLVDGQVVNQLSAGDMFGEIAVIASGRRIATVESLGAMVLVSFFKREIWALEKSNAAFADALRALRPSNEEG